MKGFAPHPDVLSESQVDANLAAAIRRLDAAERRCKAAVRELRKRHRIVSRAALIAFEDGPLAAAQQSLYRAERAVLKAIRPALVAVVGGRVIVDLLEIQGRVNMASVACDVPRFEGADVLIVATSEQVQMPAVAPSPRCDRRIPQSPHRTHHTGIRDAHAKAPSRADARPGACASAG